LTIRGARIKVAGHKPNGGLIDERIHRKADSAGAAVFGGAYRRRHAMTIAMLRAALNYHIAQRRYGRFRLLPDANRACSGEAKAHAVRHISWHTREAYKLAGQLRAMLKRV